MASGQVDFFPARNIMCLHGAICSIPFNLICNMTMHVLKKLNFDPTPRVGRGGGLGGRGGLWGERVSAGKIFVGCLPDSL